MPPRTARATAGSSLRTRGTLFRPTPSVRCHRFIPTPAGNTTRPNLILFSTPVHPRARREHSGVLFAPKNPGGSSPRLRGTRSQSHHPELPQRFIPAHTGNTRAANRTHDGTTGHPHVRGELTTAHGCRRRFFGSSPHTRETRRLLVCRNCRRRFIPACAGNTKSLLAARALAAVHPRARGKHQFRPTLAYARTGSSLRSRGTLQNALPHCDIARGTQFTPEAATCSVRFIPACVGNTD